jgi:hypothetical protein
MRWAVITPAYGRKLMNPFEAKTAFNQQKDFILRDPTSRWNNKPCNKRDLTRAGYDKVEIRFGLVNEHCIVETLDQEDE